MEHNVIRNGVSGILALLIAGGGTKLTVELAHKYNRPVLVMDALAFSENDITRFWTWSREHNIRILNVAGPRESARPGFIYRRARDVLKQLFGSRLTVKYGFRNFANFRLSVTNRAART